MKLYNSFIAVLAAVFSGITVIMAAFGVEQLDAYFTAYTLALLILTTLYVSFSPRARRALSTVGLVAFAGFMVIVAIEIVEILSGR